MNYTIGIDTSTGLGADYTSMQVLSNIPPFKQVARFRAKWSVIDTGKFAPLLGHFYNTAMIICETNFPGNAVQDALILNSMYPKNYQEESHLDSEQKISGKYGFCTTQPSKWLIIREMQGALKEKSLIINDDLTVEEMGNFVYIENKAQAGAAPGFNDDTVIALMIAFHCATLYPQKIKASRGKNLVYKGRTAQNRAIMKKYHDNITKQTKKLALGRIL